MQQAQQALTIGEVAKAALVRTCRGKGPTSACPILDALDEQETGHGDR